MDRQKLNELTTKILGFINSLCKGERMLEVILAIEAAKRDMYIRLELSGVIGGCTKSKNSSEQ